MCFSPARTRRATSSSVKLRQALSYVALEPTRASDSRVAARRSGEQKQRYACPDYLDVLMSKRVVHIPEVAHLEQLLGMGVIEVEALRLEHRPWLA